MDPISNSQRFAFGPGDLICVALVPGGAYVLDEVIDFSISTHFDKVPIRRLNHRLPVGWATGGGSIAGTLVCAQLSQGALSKLRNHAGAVRVFQDQALLTEDTQDQTGDRLRAQIDFYSSAILPQQLPPITLMFVHANQSGSMAISRLYNVVFSDHGTVAGSNQAFIEETLQYQATFYEQLKLQRSLSVNELSQLFKKPVFFSDSRAPEQLVHTLQNVLPQDRLAELFLDGSNYNEQLVSQEEAIAERVQNGTYTAQTIADQGDVVFVKLTDPSGDTKYHEAVISDGDTQDPTTIDRRESVSITESIYMLENDGTTSVQTLTAHLYVGGVNVYVVPDDGGEPDLDAYAVPIGTIRGDSGIVSIRGSDYYTPFLEGTSYSLRNIPLMPDYLQLDINLAGTAKFARSGQYDAIPIDLSYDPLALDSLAGTYTAAWDGYTEELIIDSSGNYSGRVGPFQLDSGQITNPAFTSRIQTTGVGSDIDYVFVPNADSQVKLQRQGVDELLYNNSVDIDIENPDSTSTTLGVTTRTWAKSFHGGTILITIEDEFAEDDPIGTEHTFTATVESQVDADSESLTATATKTESGVSVLIGMDYLGSVFVSLQNNAAAPSSIAYSFLLPYNAVLSPDPAIVSLRESVTQWRGWTFTVTPTNASTYNIVASGLFNLTGVTFGVDQTLEAGTDITVTVPDTQDNITIGLSSRTFEGS